MRLQNLANHKRWLFPYHVLLLTAIICLFIGSLVNLTHASHDSIYSASLLVLVSLILMGFFVFVRRFPLQAQDRAIRAEENLRHFILAGKPLHRDLTVQQIIALRFASDDEFVRLAKRAVDETLSGDEIKQVIRHWRPDYHRV